MNDYAISQVYPWDKRSLSEIDGLLQKEGITRDGNLDYICAMRDSSDAIIATGSCFGPTLRCFAVSREHQGEGLLNEIISHLMEVQQARGNLHLFFTPRSSPPNSSAVWAFTRLPGWMAPWCSWRTGKAGARIT